MSDVVQEVLEEVVRQFPQFTGQNEAAWWGGCAHWSGKSWLTSGGIIAG